MKLTPRRRAVLEVIRESGEHLTAGEIYERARARHPGLSYATVHNALNYLKRAGLVHEISLTSDVRRYDRRDPSHGHAICVECGRVCDLNLPDLAPVLNEALDRTGFELGVATVTLYGRCRECRSRPPHAHSPS